MRLLFITVLLLLVGCGRQDPHGLYVGRIENSGTLLELRYDFKRDGTATFLINTGGGIVVVHGRWTRRKEKVEFEGTFANPVSKKEEEFSQTLAFDGDDLFPENLSLRLVRQR